MEKEKRETMVIIQKTYDMIQYAYICLQEFPKAEKHTMAAEIKTSMYKFLKLCIAASKKYYKKTTLQEMDIELQFLKTIVRLSSELRNKETKAPFLADKKYQYWAKLLAEIGAMLGGWIKNKKK